MTKGTKSLLFGAHQFLLHPLLVAIGWLKQYGTARVQIGIVVKSLGQPAFLSIGGQLYQQSETVDTKSYTPVYTSIYDYKLWLAFFVHDIGYWGKVNMDDEEGERHPEVGAKWMGQRYGRVWGDFVLYHSRHYAKANGQPISPLCLADKWVGIIEPWWLYLPRVWFSGELKEYVAEAQKAAYGEGWERFTPEERAGFASGRPRAWYRAFQSYMRRWIAAQNVEGVDSWTRARTEGASV